MSYLEIFLCKAYTYIDKQKRGKLDDKSQPRIFVGYDNRSNSYHIYTEDKNVTFRTFNFLEDINPKYITEENLNFEHENLDQNISQNKHPETKRNAIEMQIGNQPEDKQLELDDAITEQP